MKAILEFDLPEDAESHKYAINGAKYHSAIEGVLNIIRNKIKYQYLPEEQNKLLEEIRNFINDEMNDIHGINN